MSEPNECPRLIEAHRLWEAEIEGRRADEVRRHLSHCSCCRAAYEEWDRLSSLLARGDPAAALEDERRPRMREELLAACAGSIEENEATQRSAPAPGAWVWARLLQGAKSGGGISPGDRGHGNKDTQSTFVDSGVDEGRLGASVAVVSTARTARPRIRSLRIALALVPLALAALWLAHALRSAPTGRTGPNLASHSGVPLPQPKHEVGPHRPILASTPDSSSTPLSSGAGQDHAGAGQKRAVDADQKVGATNSEHRRRPRRVPFHPGVSARAAKKPRPVVRSRHPIYASRPPTASRDWPNHRTRRRTGSPVIAEGRVSPSPVPRPAVAPPIERLVIQVDAPPPPAAANTRTVTHLTVIATGDLKAPGAQLTIVKSEKEEALP